MTTAIATTGINIGPYKIPANGQNMIMNNYADRNKIIIDLIIPEPMMSDALATVQWMHKDKKLKRLILCSYYQLPSEQRRINNLIKTMSNVEFHFALEGIKGKGKKFLKKCLKEKKIFSNSKIIITKSNSWLNLYKLINKKAKFK